MGTDLTQIGVNPETKKKKHRRVGSGVAHHTPRRVTSNAGAAPL